MPVTVKPSGVVKLHHVPFTADTNNTLLFDSVSAQREYFESTVIRTFNEVQYIRRGGYIKVDALVDDLWNCNYVSYTNEGFTNKVFYAFIIGREYQNENCTYLYLAEDAFQTWYYDIQWYDSFILRTHSKTDVAGDNIVPEAVTAPICYINSVNEQKITKKYDGILTSVLKYHVSDNPDNPHDITFKPAYMTDPESGIVCPSRIRTYATQQEFEEDMKDLAEGGQLEGVMGACAVLTDSNIGLSRPVSLNGYIPRNKKLLTGQYCKYVFELGGNKMEVPMDVVPNPVVTSNISASYAQGSPLMAGAYRVFLSNYGAATKPTSMSLEVSTPIVPWAYNQYANTTALHANSTAMMLRREQARKVQQGVNAGFGIAKGVAKTAVSIGTEVVNPIGAISGVQDTLDSGFSLGEVLGGYDTHTEAITRHNENLEAPATGATVITNTLLGNGQLYLSGYVYTILKQDAERIDKYFDIYGYAYNQVDDVKPFLHTRRNWNYIRCTDLHIQGNVPETAIVDIKARFSAGMTFWHNKDTFGDYSQDNSII